MWTAVHVHVHVDLEVGVGVGQTLTLNPNFRIMGLSAGVTLRSNFAPLRVNLVHLVALQVAVDADGRVPVHVYTVEVAVGVAVRQTLTLKSTFRIMGLSAGGTFRSN